MKKSYEQVAMELLEWKAKDVLTSSAGGDTPDDGSWEDKDGWSDDCID